MSGPIKPDEVAACKKATIPEEVFAAFNELIVASTCGGLANVSQDRVVARIRSKVPRATYKTILDRGWLDVEDAYRSVGWEVEYDKPGYNETYEPNFTFRRRSK